MPHEMTCVWIRFSAAGDIPDQQITITISDGEDATDASDDGVTVIVIVSLIVAIAFLVTCAIAVILLRRRQRMAKFSQEDEQETESTTLPFDGGTASNGTASFGTASIGTAASSKRSRKLSAASNGASTTVSNFGVDVSYALSAGEISVAVEPDALTQPADVFVLTADMLGENPGKEGLEEMRLPQVEEGRGICCRPMCMSLS